MIEKNNNGKQHYIFTKLNQRSRGRKERDKERKKEFLLVIVFIHPYCKDKVVIIRDNKGYQITFGIATLTSNVVRGGTITRTVLIHCCIVGKRQLKSVSLSIFV